MTRETIAIIDFGSQYGQLIARRVREHNVYSVIYQPSVNADELKKLGVKGVILSGGPASVYAENAPMCDAKIFELGVPVLGICYGMQVGCKILGAEVSPAKSREYGRRSIDIINKEDIFAHLPDAATVWMSHGDQVNDIHSDLIPLAKTATCPFAALKHKTKPFYGVQFHPEKSQALGLQLLSNFLNWDGQA